MGFYIDVFYHVVENVTELKSLAFLNRLSQHNTLRRELNEHDEPRLHRIKWYRVDQCAQALLTSKVLGDPQPNPHPH